MYPHPAFAGALVRHRVAELHNDAARSTRPASHRPQDAGLIAAARLGAGWLLIDMGLRLAMPGGGPNRPAVRGQR